MTQIKIYLFVILLTHSLFTSSAFAQNAKAINDVACKALDKKYFTDENGIVKLYGIRTNDADTRYGKWACAKVATIILQKAGAIKEIMLGVGRVEELLRHWKKIEDESSLKPGDVIVWVNRFSGRKDGKCTGGGNCHIGIVTKKGYFHNSPASRVPTFDGASLWAFKFKIGYRPPE
ncbi:MAG: hypothetical protein V1874_06410 [Spirochaetota bacterium]